MASVSAASSAPEDDFCGICMSQFGGSVVLCRPLCCRERQVICVCCWDDISRLPPQQGRVRAVCPFCRTRIPTTADFMQAVEPVEQLILDDMETLRSIFG
jgi:hypothetical protein